MMFHKVEQFIKKHELIQKNSRVVVGVSGGPDSIALLHYLWSKKKEWQLHIIVAHVNHMFRGKESKEDYEYVERFSNQLGLTFEGADIDVASYQKKHKLSAQTAARICRYDFFADVVRKYNANYLALAHHGDDQIETMLMRLVRGSTTKGLAGIQAKRKFAGECAIIRPFLCIAKEEIEAYCAKHHLIPRIDYTNEKDDYVRNRFRHYVLPFLKQENPKVHERFQHTSEMLRQDEEYLMELSREKLKQAILHKTEERIVISVQSLIELPLPLQRRAIQIILKCLLPTKENTLTSIHIESVRLLLISQHPSGQLNLPENVKVMRSYDECHFYIQKKQAKETFHHELPIPGEVTLSSGWIIRATFMTNEQLAKDEHLFILKPEDIKQPLIVRSRLPGDRMKVKGMNGTKKLKDIFIDEKIPLDKRDSWPVVTDSTGEIIWLPYLKKSRYEAIVSQTDSEQLIVLQCIKNFQRPIRRNTNNA